MEFDLTKLTPEIRALKDMGSVLYDKDWKKTADPATELYYMYRGLKEKDNLRYDITVINPIMLGEEYNKTKGHAHVSDGEETYIVLEGTIFYLIQKLEEGEVKDIYVVEAEQGDKVIVPPFSSHFSINPTDKVVKMANWVDKRVKVDYKVIQDGNGACYFYTTQGWIKNKKYTQVPDLRFEKTDSSIIT